MSKNIKFEETVECSFFSTTDLTDEQWEELCDSINELSSSLSKHYIWHRDAFKVTTTIFCESRKEIPCYLTSTTCFGDNIEDEWFIVYLILEITKQHRDIVVQIEDNDGDFLLIEAADYLPSWANPDSTVNRVFIHNNQLHIINPTIYPLHLNLKLSTALLLIKEKPEETVALHDVQQAIFQRISGYPQKIKEVSHIALLRLPVELATVLTLKPGLISPIVHTYCNSDIVDKKISNNLKFENCVTAEVKFTKCLYAMLKHSRDMNITTNTNILGTVNISQIGIKLSYAYELIMNTVPSNIYLSAPYKKFISNLTKNGYFKDNLEGSKDYKELLNKANNYFLNIDCPWNSYVCNVVSELKETSNFKNVRRTLLTRGQTEISEGDNEDWLNINPDELNEFLNKRYGNKSELKSDVNTPEAITYQLTKFLKQSSDFEGIEGRENDLIDKDDDSEDSKIEFDANNFVDCVEKMLNLISLNNNLDDPSYSEEDDDDDDDYDRNILETSKHIDKELSEKLHKIPESDPNCNQVVLKNFVQSLKEEGPSGPTSNILNTIGIKKNDLLDSDDDVI